MLSFYFCSMLVLYVILKSGWYYCKAKAPIAAFMAIMAIFYLIVLSDIYYSLNLLNLDQYAPFKGSQLYWTSSFLIIFLLITINNIYRDFVYSKNLSELVRDLALE